MPGDEIHAEHLRLAERCAQGDAEAIARVEREFFGETLDRALARFEADATLIEEVKQRLRQKLFVAEGERPPRITTYSGRGDLGRWIRVAATREAISLLRKHRGEVLVESSDLASAIADSGDTEIDHLKKVYREEFKAAFHAAIADLEPKDRTVLKYQLLDGLNIDGIGKVYGVHRATVARWIAAIRDKLLMRTREVLMANIDVDPEELDSIFRLIQSQLDVSLLRILREEK